MFFKIGVLKNFAIFTGKNLCWPLHTFFYRTPTLAASGFSRQQILFSAESGIYCWQSHLFLPRTPVETRVKRQKQPPKLLCKKGVFRNFASFTGRQLCWSLFLIELQTFRPAALLEIDSNTDVFLWNLQDHLIWSLRTPASEICSFTWTSLFNNLGFWLKLIHML